MRDDRRGKEEKKKMEEEQITETGAKARVAGVRKERYMREERNAVGQSDTVIWFPPNFRRRRKEKDGRNKQTKQRRKEGKKGRKDRWKERNKQQTKQRRRNEGKKGERIDERKKQ